MPNFIYDTPDISELHAYDVRNPAGNVAVMLSEKIGPETNTPITYVGFGLGYASLWILENRPEVPFVVVIEPSIDLFYHALQAMDLRRVFQSGKFHFLVGKPNWGQFLHILKSAPGTPVQFLSHKPSVIWRPELYQNTLNDALSIFAGNSSERNAVVQEGERLFFNRMENFSLLRHSLMTDCLKGLFHGRPTVLVAAGPSLGGSLPVLKKYVGRVVIIAVDAALAPLLREGIIPDFVTTLDFREITFEKLAPFLDRKWPFTLVANTTSSPLITKRFDCNHLFLSFQENDTQTWIHSALEIERFMPCASTVSQLSLGLAILLEADPIIFIGHDFAYTDSKEGHASGVVVSSNLKLNNMSKEFLENQVVISGINGEKYSTHINYLSQKKRLEEIIRLNSGTYINSTAKGAHIEGTAVSDLDAALKKVAIHSFSAQEMTDVAVAKARPVSCQTVMAACRNIISHATNRHKDIQNILSLIDKIEKRRSHIKNGQKAAFLPSDFREQINELEQYDKKLLLHDNNKLWLYIQELSFAEIDRNNDRVKENRKLLEIDFLKWLGVEIKIMASRYSLLKEKLSVFIASIERLLGHLDLENQVLSGKSKKEYNDLIKLSEVYIEYGNIRLAKKILEEVLEKEPSSPKVLFLSGIVNSGLLDFYSAIQNWSKAVDGDPMFESRILDFRDKEASFWFEKAKFGFGPVNEFCKRVVSLAGDRDWVKKAVEARWGNLDIDPQQTDFYVIEKILNDIKPLREILPEWYFITAKLSAVKKNLSDAIFYMEKAISRVRNNAVWIGVLARFLIEDGRFEEGIQKLKEAVFLNPETAVLWEELGDLLFGAGDYETSGLAYENCFLALPGKLTALRKLGDCYLAMNKPEAAISAYDEVLRKESDNEMAQKNRLLAVNRL